MSQPDADELTLPALGKIFSAQLAQLLLALISGKARASAWQVLTEPTLRTLGDEASGGRGRQAGPISDDIKMGQ